MEFLKDHKDNKKWRNGTTAQWHGGIIIRTVMVTLNLKAITQRKSGEETELHRGKD